MQGRGNRMTSIEFIVGVALIIAALWLGWAARASATGPIRRFAMMPVIEDYFVIFLLAVIVSGAVLIAAGAGAV
jgi:hypothetical protein